MFGAGVQKVFRQLNITSEFELIHFHSPIPVVTGLLDGKITKSVLTCGDPAIGNARQENLVSDALRIGRGLSNFTQVGSFVFQRAAVELVDKVIVVSENLKKAIERVHRLASSKVVVIHPGVDTDIFRPVKDLEGASAKIGLPRLTPTILCPARISPLKAQLNLIEAIPRLKSHIGKVRVLFVGQIIDSRYYREIVTRSRNLRVGDCVEFKGVVSAEIFPLYYATADVVVLPSTTEGLPSSLLEAMSCGRPIVATDIPGNREAVADNRGALLVPVNSPDMLADKIATAIADKEVKENALEDGMKIAHREYAWPSIASKTINLYREVIAG